MATLVRMPTSLTDAVSQAAVEACPNVQQGEAVKKKLLQICSDLLVLDTRSTFWNTSPPSPYTASLSTLNARLYSGKLSPSFATHDESSTRQSPAHHTSAQAWDRPLEDFEYLYYGLLAKIQEIHHLVCVRLVNKFTSPTAAVFEDGPTFAEVREQLEGYWGELNEPSFVKALDSAIMRARVKSMHIDVLQQLDREDITKEDADQRIDDLYDSAETGEIQGMAWIGGWAPCMIRAWIEEKYRVLLSREKDEDEREEKARKARRELEEESKRREKEEHERDLAWRRDYEKQKTIWEREQAIREHELKAERVKEYGRKLKLVVGGDIFGLGDVTWTVYGNA